MSRMLDAILGKGGQGATLAEQLLMQSIGGLPNAGNDAEKYATPGFAGPLQKPPPLQNNAQPKQGALGGAVSKLDGFLNGKGGGFLMNLLAQQGYSTMPQSRLGALGRAGIATQQQQQQRDESTANNEYRAAMTELAKHKVANPTPAKLGTPILVKGADGKSVYKYPAEAVGLEPGVKESTAAPGIKAVKGEDGTPIYVTDAEALGKEPAGAVQADIDISDEALELAATDYRLSGKIPSGFNRSPSTVAKMIGRAAEQAQELGLTTEEMADQRQEFNANRAAISKLTVQKTMVGAFEKTAQKNMELALELGKKVDRTGSPIANRGLIAFNQNALGDADTAAFVNAVMASRTEYAKVLSGATGAAGLTDSARHEAEELFSTATSQPTLELVIRVAKQEMKNRMDSFDEQMKDFRVGNRGVTFGRNATEKPIEEMTDEELAELAQ